LISKRLSRFSMTVTAAALVAGASADALAQKVRLATTMGDVVLELDAARAPKTVENFLQYVRSGHYDGTIFHRVIGNFMIQGGEFTADFYKNAPGFGQKKTRAAIPIESQNGLKNDRGWLAMARTSDPNSATAQFFINVADNEFLNHTAPSGQGWGYCVFGKVATGTEVVDDIVKVRTIKQGFHSDVPEEDIVITGAEEVA